jgi:type II pantothenate kinase
MSVSSPVGAERPKHAESAIDRLEDAISNPGAVKINVEGAFIVENEPFSPGHLIQAEGIHYERKDIRLPYHTSVVSHVAVDVSQPLPFPPTSYLSNDGVAK